MAVSIRGFLVEMYEEHLLEASALYDQLRTLPTDPEVTWRETGEFEDRLEAHLDALVVGGNLATETCRRRSVEGDLGELHAAVRIWCRLGDLQPVAAKIKGALRKRQRLSAIAAALRSDLPSACEGWLLEFAATEPAFLTTFALIAGCRRMRAGANLALQALEQAKPKEVSRTLWACGRVCGPEHHRYLRAYLEHDDVSCKQAAALTLLRLGDTNMLEFCLRRASADWAVLPLALACGQDSWRTLTRQFQSQPTEARIQALGIAGDVESIDALVSLVNKDQTHTAAAEALRFAAAAPADVFANSADCHRWWHQQRGNYVPGMRYRHGAVFSPETLVAQIEMERSTYTERRIAAEELSVRYGIDAGFEPDAPVSEQMRSIERMKELVRGNVVSAARENPWAFMPGYG